MRKPVVEITRLPFALVGEGWVNCFVELNCTFQQAELHLHIADFLAKLIFVALSGL